MSQPPPPPRRRNAPVVVYPGSPPPASSPSAAETRAAPGQPRPPSDDQRRRRILIGVGAAAVVIVIIVVAALALSGGGGGKSGPSFKASTAVDLKAGVTKIENVGFKEIAFPADVRDKVLSTIGTYVENANVKPLRTGKANDQAIAAAFDAGGAARVAGPDRGTLVDDGLPKAIGAIKVTTPPVALSGLATDDGNVVVATGTVDFQITAQTAKGTIKIHRTGSFVFAPDQGGAWKITGWTISVTRTGPGIAAAPTPAPANPAPTTATTKKP